MKNYVITGAWQIEGDLRVRAKSVKEAEKLAQEMLPPADGDVTWSKLEPPVTLRQHNTPTGYQVEGFAAFILQNEQLGELYKAVDQLAYVGVDEIDTLSDRLKEAVSKECDRLARETYSEYKKLRK